MLRHSCNRDSYAKIKESYAQTILQGGLIDGARGQARAVADAKVCEKWHLISHATLSEAVYVAKERDGDNRFVAKIIQMGVLAKVFHNQNPVNMLTYPKDLHNLFHKGASITHT